MRVCVTECVCVCVSVGGGGGGGGGGLCVSVCVARVWLRRGTRFCALQIL